MKIAMTKVGIDLINLYVCPVDLLTSELRKHHNNISERDINNVGFTSRSIVPCYEDVVTQAVNAALPIVKGHESEYNLLIVGTESSFDFGKPISTYAHRYLKLPSACSNFEINHACYSGTAALKMACSWVLQREDNKKALVIMSDLARNHINDPAELSAGSGAIAISISKNPRILELDLRSGCATQEVFDVARPTKTFEWGDPTLSLMSYLDLVEGAWNDFKKQHPEVKIQDYFSYMIFHTPLVSLVKNAHKLLMENETNYDADEINNDFYNRVEPALRLNCLTSNLYSASIYTSLISLILDRDVNNIKPISIFSYGSGACSEFFQAGIVKGAKELVTPLQIENMLDTRHHLDVNLYEQVVKQLEHIAMQENYQPNYNQIPDVFDKYYLNQGRLILDKIENYHRTYKFS